MRQVVVIGIGAGDPRHVTVEATEALREADVLFVLEPDDPVADLGVLFDAFVARHVPAGGPRVVTAVEPPREVGGSAAERRLVDREWDQRRVAQLAGLLRTELDDAETGAFLVWGTPTLYESLVGVLGRARTDGQVEFDLRLVPGISAAAALAASHGIALDGAGTGVQVMTGRRLKERGFPRDVDDVLVMGDRDLVFTTIDPIGLDIYWGAYLGTPDELLVAGPLAKVRRDIARRRTAEHSRKGWMADTYLLRRSA